MIVIPGVLSAILPYDVCSPTVGPGRVRGWDELAVTVYSGYVDNRSARIAALRRYISLFQQEEKRMTWVPLSSLAQEENHRDAKSNLRLTT